MVKAVHDLLDTRGIVPPVDVEDVYIRRPQLLERVLDRDVHRFDIVSDIVHLLPYVFVRVLVVSCILLVVSPPGSSAYNACLLTFVATTI